MTLAGCAPPVALDPLGGGHGAPPPLPGRDRWARVPAALNRRVTAELGPLPLDVLEGSLPEDLAGQVLFQSLSLGPDDAGFSGDSLLWRLDLDAGAPTIRSRLLRTTDFLMGRAYADSKWRFRSRGMVRLSPLGLQNQTNTAIVALADNRLIATIDGGRPWEFDPDTLAPIGPVGRLADYRPMAESPELNRFLCPMTITSAHPPYDPRTGEYYGVSLSIVPVPGMVYCEVLCWDGTGDLRRVPLRTPDGQPVLVSQSAHQLCVSRDHLVILDASSTIEAGKLLHEPDSWEASMHATPRPDSHLWVVDRAALREARGGSVTARRVIIPRESGHFMVDYDSTPGRLVVHSAHTSALDVAEWIMARDRHPTGAPVREDLVNAITPVGYDVGVVGRYEVDVRRGRIVDAQVFYDDWTWGTGGLTARNPLHPDDTVGDVFHANSGFPTDLALDRVYRGFRRHPHRIVPADELPWAGVPTSLVRIDHDANRVADGYFLPGDRFGWTPTFVPRHGRARGATDGYVISVVYGDDADERTSGTELWVFDAAALSSGPIAKLGAASLVVPLTLHSIWIDSVRSTPPERRVDVAGELLRRARTWRFEPEVEGILRRDVLPAYEAAVA
jgi:carotenoid cleavage dioxygenase-like enzyme